jgi:hypothetical protein
MEKILVFVIQAFFQKTDDGRLIDTVTLELIDKDAESALKRAKNLVPNKNYRLSAIIEKEIK